MPKKMWFFQWMMITDIVVIKEVLDESLLVGETLLKVDNFPVIISRWFRREERVLAALSGVKKIVFRPGFAWRTGNTGSGTQTRGRNLQGLYR